MRNPLMVALDVDHYREAEKLIKDLHNHVDFFKVGSLYHDLMPNTIKKWKDNYGIQVFLDLKFYDIPDTVRRHCAQANRFGVDFVSVHLRGGIKMIKAALDGAKDTKVLGISVLTSEEEKELQRFGLGIRLEDYVDNLTIEGYYAGIHGVVCSVRETEHVRAMCRKDLVIVNPGIRLKEDTLDDHDRTGTPDFAIKNGADYIVMGRSILRAANPLKKVEEINELLKIQI